MSQENILAEMGEPLVILESQSGGGFEFIKIQVMGTWTYRRASGRTKQKISAKSTSMQTIKP